MTRRLFSRQVASTAALLPVLLLSGASLIRGADRTRGAGEWVDYAGDTLAQKYSPLNQINKTNVKDLKVVWRWASPDVDIQKSNPLWRASRYEDTPLMVGGVLYTGTPLGIIAALDPGTGQTRWTFNPESYKAGKPHSVGYTVRGLAYWTDGREERILHAATDGYLFSLDAKTGKPDAAFGTGGKVDLTEGLPQAVRATNFTGRRAIIAGNLAIVGSAIQDAQPGKEHLSPKGNVKAFDVRTGKLVWTFHNIPEKGEFGYETWLENSAERTGNANAWAGMAYDPALDYVYVPTSAPGHDYNGSLRPGDNLFSDSLLCLEAKTGKRVWHFQVIHHDLWDYDITMHPNLADVTVAGKKTQVVVGISKNSLVFVLDRRTGKPIWPIVETKVPQSTVANRERTSPTQPIPSKPPALDHIGSTPDNVINFTPALKAKALEQLKQLEFGPLYTPPSEKGTLKVPGSLGGANWGGSAVDPETGILYVPTRLTMDVLKARFPELVPGTAPPAPAAPGPNLNALLSVDGLPLIQAPYARVTAIDLNKGERLWMKPVGNGPRNHPALKDLNLPPLGDAILGGAPLVTKSLLFVGVTYTFVNGLPNPTPWEKWNDPGFQKKVMYVFDKATGAILHVVEAEGRSFSAPMTYMHKGTQYLVVASGNGEESELVAYAVPGAVRN